ncbi:sigma-70 family RNA polymerase sigma factor [Myxacorys almedinensis]|uniref:Sigma-70 family RNA polymerase sigma factor n=1 Tax=Myxacorys almedinensis A TaxID=2690445 RepID=A0A8J8CN37_9CYAN|nr:sigma-70 family RNA polymerase sigma factor [Myxacorys almedinensis]NDJ18002.1 sigma-70 family RNA polymerase sigma factor [Myxacorys almedinensis A]
MRPRQSLLDLFSTFLQFESDSAKGWLVDARLRRHMQAHLDQAPMPEPSETFWALYWHKQWQTETATLATGHLAAYLQEVCYWSARKLALNLTTGQSLADFFQIAIAKLDRVLKGFNPQHSAGLRSYASLAFSNIIKDSLRLRQEVDICTDWALLHKLSHKRFVESLRTYGLNADTIAAYTAIWEAFKLLYAPTDGKIRKLSKPDAAAFAAIAQVYNRDRITTVGASATAATPALTEQWLTTCGKAARSFLYPLLVSADASASGQESGELLDDFEFTFQESSLGVVIAEEDAKQRDEQRSQLNAVLLRSLVKLDVQSQRLLQLYYGQGLTQQDIAKQLETKQYTVSRRLTSLRQGLLDGLGDWSQTTLHNPLDSNVLNAMSAILEDWLKVHYSHPDLPSSAEASL